MEEWRSQYKHIIGLVELYAVVVSSNLWGQSMKSRRVIYFIDNQSSLDALIKGTSGSPDFRKLLESWELNESSVESMFWFARVPSHSNIADEPSRAQFTLMQVIGAEREMHVTCPLRGMELEQL